MAHTNRAVLNLTHPLVLGWPEKFTLSGAPEENLVASQYYTNAPCAEFLRPATIRVNGPNRLAWSVPGWVDYGLTAPLSPPQLITRDGVFMRLEYTGRVPNGMSSGQRFQLVIMLIAGPTDTPLVDD